MNRTNKLYFYNDVDLDGKTIHYWNLKATNGQVIGCSSQVYSKKKYAILNAINLFGLELWNGTHSVPSSEDYRLLLEAGKALEKNKEGK